MVIAWRDSRIGMCPIYGRSFAERRTDARTTKCGAASSWMSGKEVTHAIDDARNFIELNAIEVAMCGCGSLCVPGPGEAVLGQRKHLVALQVGDNFLEGAGSALRGHDAD